MRGLLAGLLAVCLTSTALCLNPDSTSSFDLILQANLELETSNYSSPPLPDHVFEGDIALTDKQRRDIDIFGNAIGRAASKDNRIRWPGGVIPYEIDCSLEKMPNAVGAIKKAIKEWETKTCIRFVPRTNQKDYLWFFRQKGCWCNVGRIGGKTSLSVGSGCEFQHVMVHEIGHAVGFWHEQSRPDRDSYVQVLRGNILPGFESAFEKYTRDKIDSLNLPYDYESIMHYPFTAFSKNGKATLRTLRPLNGKAPYKHLSTLDAQQTNRMYDNCRKPPSQGSESREKREVQRKELSRTKRAVCRDYNYYCRTMARQGQCRANQRYMAVYCRASCGWCRSTGSRKCRDNHRYCRSWASKGECGRNPRYMHVNCKKSCNRCRTRPVTPRPRPPTKRPRPPTPRPRPPTPRPRPPTPRPRPPTPRPRPPTPKPPVGSQCGKRHYGRFPGRVVDGQTAAKNSWPWQAQLRSRFGSHMCGGSLVAPQWVLTAAHCVKGSSSNPGYRVKLGDHHLKRSDGTEQDFSLSRIIVHPGYRRTNADNDVALLKLDRPAKLNKAVSLICLPPQGKSVPTGTDCYITGWGRTGYNRPGAQVLQEATLPTVDQQTCATKMSRWGTVTSKMICAGFGGSSTVSGCFGDSGGPFVCRGPNGIWSLQGAVSWGTRTCSAGRNEYTVFARVSEFVTWIRKHIGRAPTHPPRPQTPPRPNTPPTLIPDLTPPPPVTPPPVIKTPDPATPPKPQTPRTTTRPIPVVCSSPKPLGLENKDIPDSSISASSQVNKWHSAREARLNMKSGVTGVGAWCARDNTANQYLEVDLGTAAVITHVATQGRESKYPKFIKTYAILYSDNGNSWTKHPTTFIGNIDMATTTKNSIAPPIIARYLRINPLTWKTSICMRAEFYGCTGKPTTPPTPPTTTDAPAPTTTEAPAPTTTDAPAPTTTDAPAPTTTEAPAPTTTDAPPPTPPKPPTTTDAPPPTTTDAPPPTPPKPPTTTDAPPPTTTDAPPPTTTDAPAPTTTDAPPPTTTDAPPPTTTDAPPPTPPKPPTTTDAPPPTPPKPPKPVVTIPPNPIGIRCADRHPSCPTWASAGKCSNDNYVQQNCKKSCKSKFCDRIPVRPNAPCSSPLGVGWDNILPDAAFTASSQLNLQTWDASARNARLYHEDDQKTKRIGGWCAASNTKQWLQVDLGSATYVTAVATQGRSTFFERVKTYELAYSVDGTSWEYVKTKGGEVKVFLGNCDHFTPVVNRLPRGVKARFVKFFPTSANWTCMRVEIYGCP